MKFNFRARLQKKNQLKTSKYRSTFVRHDSHQLSNNMSYVNDGGGDDRNKLFQQLPTPVNEQQIANAQNKVNRLMNAITDTYEKTLVRNLRLEELDMRSTDLFRDAEKMKNMAHKMQDKFFWEDSKFVRDENLR